MLLDATKAKPEGRAEFPRISLKKDETARICILSSKDWEVTVRHFVERMGYINCLAIGNAKDEQDLLKIEDEGGDPLNCILCDMSLREGSGVSRPFRRFAVRVLRYGTNPEGILTPGPLKFWLEIWIIDNGKYRQLRRIMEEWGALAQHDLSITCSDAQYQKISIDVKKEAMWVKEKDAVVEYWKKERVKYNLGECLAQNLTKDVLERKLSVMLRRTQRGSVVDLEDESMFSGTAVQPSSGEDKLFEIEDKGEESFTTDKKPEVVSDKELEQADFIKDLGID